MINIGRSLSKLSIVAYLDRELKKQAGGIQAAYNPATVDLSYEAVYEQNDNLNELKQTNRFQQLRPGSLSVDLLFDATLPDNSNSIEEQIADLRNICYPIDPRSSEPRFLKISWGQLKWHGKGYFAGRMRSMSVKYTLFDRNATPLRAHVHLVVMADESLVLQQSEIGISLPQITMLTVPDMSSLASVASGAQALIGMIDYGKAAISYLDLAFDNDLDNLDDVEPGDSLVGRKEDA